MVVLNVLKKVFLNVGMAFFGEKLLTKAAFGILKVIADKTSNTLDDTLVRDAEDSYYGRKQG